MNRHVLPDEVRWLALLILATATARSAGYGFARHIPFLEVLDAAGSAPQWEMALYAALFAGVAIAWIGGFVRTGALLAGCALVLRVLGNMPNYSNGTLFTGLILILIGLYAPPHGLALLRAQCVILYAGAALSKCLDPDWLNGRFVSVMLDFHLRPGFAAGLRPFAQAGGILTILAEAAIAILLTIPRFRRWGAALAVLFHTMLLVVLNEDFGTFYYSAVASVTLLFAGLPAGLGGRRPALFLYSAALTTAATLGYFGRFKPRTLLLTAVVGISFFLWTRYKMSGNETNPVSAGADRGRAEPQSFRQSAGGD